MEHAPLVIKKELAPEEKIAVLLASLDQKLAGVIMQQLEPSVMIRVANAIRSLGVVPGPVRDKAIAECLHGIQELGGAIQGDERMVNSLLTQAVGEKRAATMLNEQQITRVKFADLAVMSAEQVAGILSREQPGVVAMVLRYIPPVLSAEILDLLPSEVRRRVIVFICTADEPSEEIITRVESLTTAKTGPSKKMKKGGGEVDKLDIVTGIIQHAKRSVEEDLLGAIQEKSESLATEIRDRLFTFEDIVRLSDIAMRRVMQEVDMGVLGIALRNATPELRDKFFRNMSKRAGEALREEMEFSQKVRLTDVEAKQREIVNVIRTLAADGQISLSGEDEYV